MDSVLTIRPGIFLPLFTFAMAVTIPAPSAAHNLLPSPDFETGTQTSVPGWQLHFWQPTGGQRSSGSVSETIARTGTKSLQMSGVRVGNHAYWSARNIPAEPNKRYVLSTWVLPRAVMLPYGYMRVHISFTDATGNIIHDADRPMALGWAWTQIDGYHDAWVPLGLATVSPPETAFVAVTFRMVGIGEVFFDDAELVQSDTAEVAASPPGLWQDARFAAPGTCSGETEVRLTVKNPYPDEIAELQVQVRAQGGITGTPTVPVALAPGASLELPVQVRFPDNMSQQNRQVLLDGTYVLGAEERRATWQAVVNVIPTDLMASVHEDRWGLTDTAPAADAQPLEVVGTLRIRGSEREFISSYEQLQIEPDDRLAVILRISGVAGISGAFRMNWEVLDYFFRNVAGDMVVNIPEGRSYLARLDLPQNQVLRLYNAGREGTGDTLRVITRLQRDAVTVASNSSDLRMRPDLPPATSLEPLANERFDDVDIFGRLRLVDEVICADPNTPHSFRQGGRGLFNKTTSEPLGYYGDRDRLSYDWYLEYRDDRDEFSRIETILGKDCRVTEEWGWFAYHMGRNSLEPGKYYVMEIEYPEDTSRQFLIWNRLDVSASFGFHTGSALGDAPARQRFMQRVDLPLSNQYQRHYSLLRAIATEGWVGLHTLGGSSTPFSEGLAVHAIRIYELGDTQALENLALEVNEPEGLPRRTLGFIHEDANPAAHVLHKYRFWGLNMYTPVTLMYGGYAWGGHTGWIGWDTSLYGPENLRHTFAVKHPSYFNHRPGPPEDVLIEAEKLGMQAFTLLEYTGTGQLPPEAFATWPDGSIRGFSGGTTLGPDGLRTLRYYDDTATVDMAHPAVGEDLAKLITEVATLYSRHASFKGVVLTHRFQAWQIGYGADSLHRFAAEKEFTLPPENAGQWVHDNHRDAYYAWHREQKRLNLLRARDALQAVDSNLQLMIMNYNAGDDNLHFGSPLYWWDKPEGDEFMTPNEVSFPDFNTLDLAALIEDYTRPDIATLSPGMNPPLYSEDRGIWNLAMSRYPFLSDNPDYLNHFRTGEGSAVLVWWVYNEDAFNNHREIGWNCPGLHGNEGSGRYSMLDEVQIMAAGDPFVLAVRIGHLNRGYPRYAREFAAAYRALPAVPSEIVPIGDDPDVVVRRYDTANGVYLALLHKGLGPDDATVTLTREIAGGPVVHNLVTGERITIGAGTELRLPPVSLTSLQVVNE